MPVLSSYVRDHAALPRMSANADFSTLLKCLASGKKSIEQLRPSAPRQTSALELLVVYCFLILLVYPCPLYCGMLVLSRVHGACATPPPPPPWSTIVGMQNFNNYLLALVYMYVHYISEYAH